jgi:hypothetical protein
VRTLGVVAVALALPIGAPAAAPRPFPVAEVSFSDPMHGWAPNYALRLECESAAICSTDDGGRTWETIFQYGTFLKDPLRTSASAGVVQSGRFAFYPWWTRDGGRTWYAMERPPAPNPGLQDPTPPQYQGHAHLLFLHYFGRTLYRVVPWPPRSNPPCVPAGQGYDGVCGLPPANGGLEYRPLYTLAGGRLGPMRNVPGGVAAPVYGDEYSPQGSIVGVAALIPHAVLVHRAGVTAVHGFPGAPPGRNAVGEERGLAVSWPWMFVAGYRGVPDRCCERIRAILWRSGDGGATWRVEETGNVRRRPRVAFASPPTNTRFPLAGGWIATVRGRTALAIRQARRTRVLHLPLAGCAPRLARPRADWPYLYVEAVNRRLRWYSDDGGRSWAIFGHCG